MLETNRNKKNRRKIAVNLDTGDGDELVYMFVYPTERVIDTLNDERAFLPFEQADGSVTIVAKKIIRRLSPMEVARQINARDPYDLLGVSLTATDEEVREAYHRAVAAVHPDRVHSLGLPGDFLEMATRQAAQLNDAYRKIKAVRKAEGVGFRDEPAA
ncbi:MAG TPA: DnaJ domain-containing protein [Dongiaceae bacterium]|nr:DnaJ domain-containing protein [Dongiaceae bacterium]